MLKDAALLELDLRLAALDEGPCSRTRRPTTSSGAARSPSSSTSAPSSSCARASPGPGTGSSAPSSSTRSSSRPTRACPSSRGSAGRSRGSSRPRCARLLGFRDRFRRGVLTNVVLHARLEGRYADRDVKSDLKKAGFHAELIRANARKLRKLVQRLEWEPGRTAWSDYGEANPYDDADAAAKEAFVREAAGRAGGACSGTSAPTTAVTHASPRARPTTASLSTPTLRSWRRSTGRSRPRARARSCRSSATSPTPPPASAGAGRAERRSRSARRPDLTLCLALVHHVALSSNVPVRSFLDWLAELETEVVVEFPTRDDPMVQRLLSRKGPGANPDYDTKVFERAWTSAGASSAARSCPPGPASSTVRFRPPDPPGSFRDAGLHLAGLSALAVAQPLFDLLSDNVEFFAVRGSTRWDVVLFAVGIVVLPPLVLLGVEVLAGLAHARAAALVHLVFVAALVGLLALQVVRGGPPSLLLVVLAAALGAAAAVLYTAGEARAGAPVGARRDAGALPRPLPLLLAGLAPPREPAAAPPRPGALGSTGGHGRARRAPLVSLMRADGEIDASATRTSRGWPRTPPGTGTPRPCTNGRRAPSPRSSPASGPEDCRSSSTTRTTSSRSWAARTT